MSFDVIVVGTGTMGIAACASLARRGARVLGLDQFNIPHDQGSHSGYTRIIRQAYYEHPGYVPLLQRSYQLWQDLESDQNLKLYHETGILYMGQADSPILEGTLKASSLYGIPVQVGDVNQMLQEHTQFTIPHDWKLLWEPHAGYLNVNQSLSGFYHQALAAGATILTGEKVESWKLVDGHIEVHTGKQTYQAEKLILTAGPWMEGLLTAYGLPLKVTRQVLAWIDVPEPQMYSDPQFSSWFLHDPAMGMFYGFPLSKTGNPEEPKGIKLGLHMPGLITHPDQVDRAIHDTDKETIQYFIDKYMPQLRNQHLQFKTCMYTYTPDEHFIVDYLPETDKNVMIAGGFSGHGFKFAPVIGEILTDLFHENRSAFDLGFLGLNRFQKI